MITTKAAIEPVLHGEILFEEFLKPLSLSATALARRIGAPVDCMLTTIAGKQTITGNATPRLVTAFSTTDL